MVHRAACGGRGGTTDSCMWLNEERRDTDTSGTGTRIRSHRPDGSHSLMSPVSMFVVKYL